ncbi:STAS domain-containing protein [Iamia sp.]|jgi:anti-sigma B factor antagonist|uniref:STAS domain-containing protein n=1 Tax=Iamia sp. TaxID=2722710 RepID=UPI002C9FE1F5|nr:STAS domain-containing protein [Iamia sp.]HXH59347.1 STAS domain-containing protein [Iamia sp.]
MTLAVHVDDLRKDLVLISLDGAVDAATATQVKEALEPFATRPSVIVVLDFEALTFIDSAGLGTLIATQRHLREVGSELRLTRVPSHVQRLLQITALDQALPIHHSSLDEEE